MALKTKAQLLSELTARVRSGGSGGQTTAQDLRDFLTSLTAEVYARDEAPHISVSLPPVYATDGLGAVVYQGGSLYEAILAVSGGAGLILCFTNVSLDLPDDNLSKEVVLPISTTIICHYGILSLQHNTLTLTDRCRLVQARVQLGTIRSNYGALDARTPKYEGGVSYDVPLDVETGCYLIAEGVDFSGVTKPWLMRTSAEDPPTSAPGTGVLRGTTQLYVRTNAPGTTVLDQRASATPAVNQVELHLEFEALPSGVGQAAKEVYITAAKAGSYPTPMFDNVSQVDVIDLSDNSTQTRTNGGAWTPIVLAAGRSYRFLLTPATPAQGGAFTLTT